MVDYSMQPDPLNAFSQGYGMVKGLRQDRAMQTAGAAMAGGDGQGARAALYGAGMIDQGNALQDREAKDAKDKLSFVKDIAIGLGRIPDADGRQTERRKALSQFRQTFQAMGLPDDAVARMEAGDLSDQALGLVAGEIDKQLQMVPLGDGGVGVFDTRAGTLNVLREPQRKRTGAWKERANADGSSELVWLEEPSDDAAPAAPAPDAAGAQATPPGADETWRSMIQRESGGKPGVLGPQTAHGRAEGMTQMLPATAEAMARKLGVAWRPDLMRGTTPNAAAYQEKLGRAYYEEGLQKYGGDTSKAAMYYHGGPDEKQWGPKTRAYAQAVAPNVFAGGSGADVVMTSGPPARNALRSVPWNAPKPGKGKEPPSGYEWGPNGTLKAISGGPADPANASAKAPTDGDKQSVAYAFRTIRANDRLNGLADRGIFKPRSATAQLFETSKSGAVRLVTKTPEDRQFFQAAKEWLAPILRKDTGAAVTDGELATYMDIYIPRFEDDQTTMQQKAEARQDAMTALVRQAGPLYNRTHGQRTFQTKYPGAKSGPKTQGGSGSRAWKVIP